MCFSHSIYCSSLFRLKFFAKHIFSWVLSHIDTVKVKQRLSIFTGGEGSPLLSLQAIFHKPALQNIIILPSNK
jgi:hypothetical protein